MQYEDVNFKIVHNSFVCDAPTRAMITKFKGHCGYFGCDKCQHEGEWKGKVTFSETNSPLRTDIQFDEITDPDHHLGKSPLSSLGIGMVAQFQQYYMHLVCLGVTRRLLLCWLKGPFNVRIGTNTISELSNKLLSDPKHAS